MKNEVMQEVYLKLGTKTKLQECVCNELVLLLFVENSSTGYEGGMYWDLRKTIYGDSYNSLEERIL